MFIQEHPKTLKLWDIQWSSICDLFPKFREKRFGTFSAFKVFVVLVFTIVVHISEWGDLKPTLARENVQRLGTVAFIEKIKEWVVESASELV